MKIFLLSFPILNHWVQSKDLPVKMGVKTDTMRRILIFLMLALVSQSKLHAQATFAELENKKILYPSPTASSLGKYGEYPVSLYNGLVNIGQDIVTVKSGQLSLDVSLSYHASGNRPSDIPGWVGLGFSLNAGGVITRVIKDLPDDSQRGYYADNTNGQNLWNNYLTHYYENYNSGTLDPRSDVYQFNFCGKTGEFVFDWDRNIHFKQKLPFKVEVLGSSLGFTGFKITTDDGTVYTFDQSERSSFDFSAINNPATSWYLTKIENLSGDNIVLKYTSPATKFRYKQYSTRKDVTGTSTIPGWILSPGTANIVTSTDEVIYLDEIDFNNGKLIFGRSTRTDPYFVPAGITSSIVEEKKLDLITLKDNSNNVIKNWKFEYYENSTERLKLKNLIVQGSDQTGVQKYAFSYNPQKLPLPLPGPKPLNPYSTNDVDYWGYYNGAANGENRIPKMYMSEFDQYFGKADRSINPSFVKAEMLEKITYPTGGYTSFEYESNDYSDQGASFALSQNPMYKSSTLPESYEVNYNRDDGGFDVDPTTVSFTLTQPTHIYIRYSCGADGNLQQWANSGVTYEYDLQFSAGTYTLQSLFNTNVLLLPGSADITAAHCFATVYKADNLVPIYAKTGPGLRIKSILTNDGITTTTRRFEYKKDNPQNPSVSSGYLSVFPAFYVPLEHILVNIQGFYAASEPINDIGDGSPVGYSRVVERFQDNSSIVHHYTTYEDYPDEIMPFMNGSSNANLAHMSSMDFMRGLENHTAYYNENGILLKDITNDYTVLPESKTDVQSIELKPTVDVIQLPDSPINFVNVPLTSVYYLHSCFLYNSTRTETTYDKNGQHPVTATVNKNYDNVKHLQPTRIATLNSDGSSVTTATTYPDDYAPGVPFINYMQANHLTSFPVEQVVYKQKDNVTNIVGGSMVTYKTQGAGLPEQLLKLETPDPILQANFKFSNRLMGVLPGSGQLSMFSADTRYQPELTYTLYDNKGNLLESARPSGVKTAYLYGYNQELPVAEIIGTDYPTAFSKINNPSILNGPSSDQALRAELNNLRTIPGSSVTTYTFAPLTGVTSQTEPNGRTTYYEYDLFNRLSIVRDQNQNILKKICYNYAGQAGGCNIYRSTAIDDDYYSQNCSSGQSPVAYHVSVPQGKFASSLDQAAANQLAQQYAQNLANEHGSCVIPNVSVYAENNHGVNITILLHNVVSGQNYSFTISPHDAGTLGEVPPGNYNITLTPQSSTGYYSYWVGCGYYYDGPGAITFYGVDINASCSSIAIDS